MRLCSLLFGAGLVLATACATRDYAVSQSFDSLTRFPEQATYWWNLSASTAPADPRLAELPARVMAAADEVFAARGYRVTPRPPADFHLAHRIEVQSIVGGEFTRSVGTLWLQLREAATRRLVWGGAARGKVYVGLDEVESHERLREVFEELLADFPPRQRPE